MALQSESLSSLITYCPESLIRFHFFYVVIPTPHQVQGKLQWKSKKEILDSCFRRNDFLRKRASDSPHYQSIVIVRVSE